MGTLTDIRDASAGYVARDVVVAIENLKADAPEAVSPGEGFSFDVKWTHNGMIPLINVRLLVSGQGGIQLVAPANAYSDLSGSAPIPRGSLTARMYLMPQDAYRRRLEQNESEKWTLRGRAESLGTATIEAWVIANLDLDWLFPPNQQGKPGRMAFPVV